jgi:hypothetical protein
VITNIKQEVGANGQWNTTIEANPFIPDSSFNILTLNQDNLKLNTINKQYVYDGNTGQVREEIQKQNNDPIGTVPNGITGNKAAICAAMNYVFNTDLGTPGRCARYVYNIARNYNLYASGKGNLLTRGASQPSGGNANEVGYRKNLEQIGYTSILVARDWSKQQILNYISKESFNIGDIINYASGNTFHTQIYTGGVQYSEKYKSYIPDPKSLLKWESSYNQNYQNTTGFVYESKPSDKWELYVLKKTRNIV